MRVHGDINNSDTRTILVLLEASGIPFNFKQAEINEMTMAMLPGLDEDPMTALANSMGQIAKNSPVIEDSDGKKILGGPQAVMQFCVMKGLSASVKKGKD